mgnify:CR=1 FL=1
MKITKPFYVLILSSFIFAVDKPALINSSEVNDHYHTSQRDQIDLFYDDFESTADEWNPSEGWQINYSEYHTETTSYQSPDELPLDENGDPAQKNWDLFSPLYSLPALGDGESMHFDFWLNLDMPGAECDGDSYLDDYYGLSIMTPEDLAWHTSVFNPLDGPSWHCAFEDLGSGSPGYLDAWVQYLDTPSFTVPAFGTISADMFWAMEDYSGAVVSGTCTDGWDQANVQISVDGGATFSMLEGSTPYDFGCGYGMVYNGFECNSAGGLGDIGDCPGWGGYSDDWQNITFDLGDYAGQDAIVRFAFYSDPGYSSIDDPSMTGFQVDNIIISGGAFSDTADDEDAMSVSGAVWNELFYDYYSQEDNRPGSNGWEQYVPGLPFNGNVFMNISEYQGKEVVFRFQTRLGELTGACGEGEGVFIDDFRIYKELPYLAPTGLVAESGDSEVYLSWDDMNSDESSFTYSLYRDGNPNPVVNGLTESSYTDSGLNNNQDYYYQVTATYPDGTESDYSNVVYVTPFADTVVELAEDDGTAESSFNAGSGNTQAVRFEACSEGAQLVRFKWYQTESAGGAFYVKIHADNNGMPGDELLSTIAVTTDLGWNERNLSGDDLVVSGPFWAAIKEFSSTRPIGLDTSTDAGLSMENSSGEWMPITGNPLIRVFVDNQNCNDFSDDGGGETGGAECDDGYVQDCADEDCCPESWIGDGFADCEDQEYGCDLTCYDNDGGDCESLMMGDANGDGILDILDIITVVNIIMNDYPYTNIVDMNYDGEVNIFDIIMMVNIIIGN